MTPNRFKTERDVRRQQLRRDCPSVFKADRHECEADGDWQERERRVQAKITALQPLYADAAASGAKR